MDIGEQLIKYLAYGAVSFVLFGLAAWLQGQKARKRNDWHHLTQGPLAWATLIIGVPLSGVFNYMYFFVGSARDDTESQMVALLLLTGTTTLIAILAVFTLVVEEVRWNENRLERRTLLLKRLALNWGDLAEFGYEPTGYLWVRAENGPKLRFSEHANGCEQLVRKILEHLPDDDAPDEPEPSRALLATATALLRP